MKKIILLGFYLFIPFMCLATSSLPSAQTFCEHPWENFPVLAGGRVKPLWVHAKESLQLITGNKKIINSMNLFCHLSLKGQGIGNPPALFTSIEHKNLQEFLSLGTAKEIEIEKLLERKSEIQLEYNSLAKNDGYKKELSRLFSRMNLYEEIIHGISWTLPTPQNAWTSLSDLAMDPHFFTKPFSFFKNMQKDFIQSHGKRYQLESFYFKFHLFSWSMLFIFCALFTLVLLKNKKVGLGFVLLAIILQLTAMILRILISQRAPVTNMYETVMFSGLGSLIVSVFIYRYKKELLFVIAGLSYNVLCLFMMTFAHGMLSPQISPLVPVLRDNFWLSTHVTTVVLSYG
ncbi:MAG: hypothetical protein KBD63_06400, partial [Bacteriovoracaceae bacterium]|nr:hypothetical protein [Bacteriovoracaceae bacterium]